MLYPDLVPYSIRNELRDLCGGAKLSVRRSGTEEEATRPFLSYLSETVTVPPLAGCATFEKNGLLKGAAKVRKIIDYESGLV